VDIDTAKYDSLRLDDGSFLTDPEGFVLNQAAAGLPADLGLEYGPDRRARCLRGRFLEKLLTGGFGDLIAPRTGLEVREAVVQGELNLRHAVLSFPLSLPRGSFQGVNFRDCLCRRHLDFREGVFQGPAQFHRLTVQGSFDLRGALFLGPVDFRSAEISRNLVADGVTFADSAPLSFNRLHLGVTAFFRGAAFHGPVDFVLMQIGGNLLLAAPENGNAAAVFWDAVDFSGAVIDGQLDAEGTVFAADTTLSFNSLRVGHNAMFERAQFQAPVDFISAVFGNQLKFSRARLHGQASFAKIKVADTAFFHQTTFQAGVSFQDAHLGDLYISETSPSGLNLERARIARDLSLTDLQIEELRAGNLQVQGPATLADLTIAARADLRDAAFQPLYLMAVTWPASPDEVWLDGLTYIALSTRADPKTTGDWEPLLQWLQHSRFNPQNYAQLEDYFRRCGRQGWADTVFIAGRRRALEFQPSPWRRAMVRFFWDFLTRYGRKPGRTLWASLLVVLLGAFWFDPRLINPEVTSGWPWLASAGLLPSLVLRLLLSLNQFLPGIDLGLAKELQLSRLDLATLLYLQFHRFCGWLLIPIGLAALTTKLKR